MDGSNDAENVMWYSSCEIAQVKKGRFKPISLGFRKLIIGLNWSSIYKYNSWQMWKVERGVNMLVMLMKIVNNCNNGPLISLFKFMV